MDVNFFIVDRPYVPYNWIITQDFIQNLKFDASLYCTMVTYAKSQVHAVEEVDIREKAFKAFYSSCGEDSEYAQAYGHVFLRHLDRFRIVLDEVGFVDYIAITPEGDVEIHTVEHAYNKYEQFINLIEGPLEFIPVMFTGVLDLSSECDNNVLALTNYYNKIKALWSIEEKAGRVTTTVMNKDGELIITPAVVQRVEASNNVPTAFDKFVGVFGLGVCLFGIVYIFKLLFDVLFGR